MAESHESVHRSKREIFLNNFLGGIAWGLGASIGLSILLAAVGYIISQIDWVPIVGSIMSEASSQVLQNQLQLIQ